MHTVFKGWGWGRGIGQSFLVYDSLCMSIVLAGVWNSLWSLLGNIYPDSKRVQIDLDLTSIWQECVGSMSYQPWSLLFSQFCLYVGSLCCMSKSVCIWVCMCLYIVKVCFYVIGMYERPWWYEVGLVITSHKKLWNVITYPCLRYLVMAHISWSVCCLISCLG